MTQRRDTLSAMARFAVTMALSCALLPACASDALPLPEPDLETPGAFIAVDEGGDALTLHRTLTVAALESGRFIFLSVYDVNPRSFAEAREMSKRHDLPLRFEGVPASLEDFPSGPYEVVWFRTLTDEELERAK
jgi:hypothetical protein